MFRLAMRTLHKRKGSFVASFIVLFLGALIVMACGGLMETGIRFTIPAERLSQAPIVVTGSQASGERARLPSSLTAQFQTTNGVQRVVPDISFAVALLSSDKKPLNDASQLSGHGWSSAGLGAYHLLDGVAPSSANEVALSSSLAQTAHVRVGSVVGLVAQGATGSFRISGIVNQGGISSPTFFFSDATAVQLSTRPGLIDNIGIFPNAGMSSQQLKSMLEKVADKYEGTVLTGNKRGLAEFPASGQTQATLISVAGAFGGLSIMVTIFIVSGLLAISVQQRRREMALMRAIGATKKQLSRMILGETLFVSIIAIGLAYAPSAWLGNWLLRELASGGVVPSGVTYHQGLIPRLVGVAVSLLTAIITAIVAARGATRVRPIEALVESIKPGRWLNWFRLLCGLLFLGGATALSLVTALVLKGPGAASTATPGAMLWAFAVALFGPGLTAFMLFVVAYVLKGTSSIESYLAILNLRFRSIRVSGIVAPIMLVTTLATALIYLQTTQNAIASHTYSQVFRGDMSISSSTGGLPFSAEQVIASLPSVKSATAAIVSTAVINISPNRSIHDYNETPLIGVTAQGIAETVSYRAKTGSLSNLTGNDVALSVHQATSLDEHVGDMVPTRLGDGTQVNLKLVATFPVKPGYDVALVPATLLSGHTTTGLLSQVAIRPRSDDAAVTSALYRLRSQYPTLQVIPAVGGDSAVVQNQVNTIASYLLVAIVVMYTSVAIVNTLIITTLERQRDLALGRLIGMTLGQTFATMTIEAIIMCMAGIVLGTIVGAFTIIPFCLAATGSPFPTGSLLVYAVIVASVLLLTVMTTWLALWFTLRKSPVQLVQSRE